MLSIQLDNQLENMLFEKFNSISNIQDYIKSLIIEDLEDKKFENILKNSNQKEYIDKQQIFNLLEKKCK